MRVFFGILIFAYMTWEYGDRLPPVVLAVAIVAVYSLWIALLLGFRRDGRKCA